MNKLSYKNSPLGLKAIPMVFTIIFLCIIFASCDSGKSTNRLSMEEIKEKADFLLSYEQAYNYKNLDSDDGIPRIAGISHNMDDEENRTLHLYYADGTTEEIPITLIYTYASLKNMKESELIGIFGAEYENKIESLNQSTIYMILPKDQIFTIDIDNFICTYLFENKIIRYPINQKELFKKAGVPNMK